jgi:hypothetical protein
VLLDASRALTDHGRPFDETSESVLATPGLYAVHGGANVWRLLGLGARPDDRPLYVGKAEHSLAGRDVRTHFATGKTGSSTLRRSLAGLLRAELGLKGMPRNPAKPGYFSNYGLEAAGDAALTAWMRQHLRLATWSSPSSVDLGELETEILRSLEPPLNIDSVRTPWRPLVRAGRAALATEAREWPPSC